MPGQSQSGWAAAAYRFMRLKSPVKHARMCAAFAGALFQPASVDDSEQRAPGIGYDATRPHRLDGLGHRAFNAATRVRIPLGTPWIQR